MLDIKNAKVKNILQEFHRKVGEKAGRFKRISNDIVLENMLLQVLCANIKLSPVVCAERIFNKYAFSCSVDDIIRIYRDYKINTLEKRTEVFEDATALAVLLEKSINGSKQSMELYYGAYKKFMEKKHERNNRIILAMVLQNIPELLQEDDRELILNLGNTMCKYLLYDIENAISATYGFNVYSGGSDKKPAEKPQQLEQKDFLQKISSLESALEQSNLLLSDLQNEFDERLEAVKLQEMSDFFGRLNSDKYGCILDELLELRKGIDAIKKSGYSLPLEINGLLIMVRKLVQFVRDSHINPILKPNSVRCVKAADVEFWNYDGSAFASSEEEKRVMVISPGWIYTEIQVQISRPKVKEVIEHVD